MKEIMFIIEIQNMRLGVGKMQKPQSNQVVDAGRIRGSDFRTVLLGTMLLVSYSGTYWTEKIWFSH